MTFLRIQNQNIINRTVAIESTESTGTSTIKVPVGQSSDYSSSNTNTTDTSQIPLDKALAEVLGENYPKIKDELKRIFEKLGIQAPRKKGELTEEKIKKIVEIVQKLVDNLKTKKLEINAENIFIFIPV